MNNGSENIFGFSTISQHFAELDKKKIIQDTHQKLQATSYWMSPTDTQARDQLLKKSFNERQVWKLLWLFDYAYFYFNEAEQRVNATLRIHVIKGVKRIQVIVSKRNLYVDPCEGFVIQEKILTEGKASIDFQR